MVVKMKRVDYKMVGVVYFLGGVSGGIGQVGGVEGGFGKDGCA